MSYARRVIATARAEVGTHEGRSSGRWNNIQKYSPAVPGLEWSQGQAWCSTFVSWVFRKAGCAQLAPVTASCAVGVDWFRSRGRFTEYPVIGGPVYFGPGGGSHVGICIAYTDSTITTVEGNTNINGSAEGDGVYLKSRPRKSDYVYGYGIPDYPEGVVLADPAWRTRRNVTYFSHQASADDLPTTAPGGQTPEDNVSLTPQQAQQLAELHDVLVPYAGWQYKGKGEETDAYAYLRGTNASVKALTTQIAAQTAAISRIAQLVGSGVNTQQVVDAVEKAIAEAVVKVDVDVTGVDSA
ncbi:hypothetical protein OEIGOIKO_05738 [Streptomyces chrestomyceticus JCM 4735]|uniref:Peptidase C51 domain-containing protein n=1 Tax=Streptomyces chrestomyceticus JCM 4735 TaxID=1306181 RepID=A0A7U9PZY3_9ACTN|nr:CHAP domain-containing protein [Streptomyces chrestomyceticus]GCD37928.1 hypothetical protein OEIGOIKO_05738 [Streptomyces chrestomyceticus JCM 4735]